MAARYMVDKWGLEHGYTCVHFLKWQRIDFQHILTILGANSKEKLPKEMCYRVWGRGAGGGFVSCWKSKG